ARAISSGPSVIVLDEPVASLDMSVRAQILNLLGDLQAEFGYTYVFISHDLAAVRYMSHTIGVMYLGKLVELADSESFHAKPLHPYAQGLLVSKEPSSLRTGQGVLAGEVPNPIDIPPGCRFHPRCPHVFEPCPTVQPELLEQEVGHQVACHLYT